MKIFDSMKRQILLILSVLCGFTFNISAQNNQKTDEYDVYLLIGQSNMAGRGYMLEGDKEIIDSKVFILNENGEVVPARNPLNIYSSIRKNDTGQKICPGFGFARKLASKVDRKILLVVNARGGTTLAQWTKGSTGEGYYEEAVRRTKQAMEYGTLKAILWHQGCGDARKANVYLPNLAIFVESLRTDLGVSVPFIAGELGRWRPHVAAFNETIHGISKYIPDSDWVSSEGCVPIVTKNSDGKPDLKDAHFDRESQILLGERYAEKVLKMCY